MLNSREVAWTTARGCTSRGMSPRGQHNFSKRSCEVSVSLREVVITVVCVAGIQMPLPHNSEDF